MTTGRRYAASGPPRRLRFAGSLLILTLLAAACVKTPGPPTGTAFPQSTAGTAADEIPQELPSSLAALAPYTKGITSGWHR